MVGSKKGILLTAILGGLISSTAVTWSYAAKSIEVPELSKNYSAGIVMASAIMFPRIALLVYIFNKELLIFLLLPFAIMTIICFVTSLILINRETNRSTTSFNLGNPLNIENAIAFGFIYIVIRFAVFYGNAFFGDKGLYYTALISGLADTDAISISMSKFSLSSSVALETASLVIITAILSNMLMKIMITFFKGSKKAWKLVGSTFIGIIFIGTLFILIAKR